ncbi:MAG: sugar transferase [Pseudomonadota bacterium]
MTPPPGYRILKRVMDVAGTALLLIPALPIGLAVTIAILIEDRGAPFFGQTRIGLSGRPFRIWKFRSMVPNAANLGPHHTAAGDPRITRVGRVIRKTSLDELPQIWNVLTGEMSLVGPRPDTPVQEGDYPPDTWRRRISVLPGITGYAQVLLKTDLSGRSRTDLDLDYIARRSLALDLWVLWATVAVVLRRQNR